MSYTIPGRFHLIIRRNYVWATLWLFGRRLHIGPKLSTHGSHE